MKIFSTQIFNFDVRNQIFTPPRPITKTKPMGMDSITFGYSSNLKNISKLPCACCGIPMITNDEFLEFQNNTLFLPSEKLMKAIPKNYSGPLILDEDMYSILKKLAKKYPKHSFQKILTEKNIEEIIPNSSMEKFKKQIKLTQEFGPSAKKVLSSMEKHAQFFPTVEKEVFLNLRKLSHKNPRLTLKGLLNLPEIHDKHLKQLEKKQLAILNKVQYYSEVQYYSGGLSEQSKELIKSQIEKTKEILFTEDSATPSKRGRCIHLFYDLEKQIPDFKAIIMTLPTSSNDIDAFFIKYAQRSSSEIANRLIRVNTATIEHVKPRSLASDRGNSDESNYIVMCSKCNGKRRQTRYDKWVKIHPEMIKNTQKQLDQIIHLLNIGNIRISSSYPRNIKSSLYEESKGLINVNISNWKGESKEDRYVEELLEKYNKNS